MEPIAGVQVRAVAGSPGMLSHKWLAQEDHVLVGARDGSTHDVKGSQGSV